MALVYGHKSDVIGPFADTGYLVTLLERTFDVEERDRLVSLLAQLVNEPKNVKALLDADGVKCLVDLLPLAHFHTRRAVLVTQTNVIEAGADMTRELADKEKEWYFSNSAQERLGPFSLNEMKELFKKVFYFFSYKFIKEFQKKVPGGRVVSVANCHAWRLGFDPSQTQNFFRKNRRNLTIHY